jgi:hypothetical protein
MGRREDLIAKFVRLLESGDVLPVVSLEEFFEGNEDRDSMATNLNDVKHPGIAAIYRTLLAIRRRPDVQDVLVEVQDAPYADDPGSADEWPTSNVLFVLTSAALEVVKESVRPLHPDLVHEGWNVTDGIKTPTLNEGMRPVRVWWD